MTHLLIPLIATTCTSQDAWIILFNTYAKPYHRCTITKYMLPIKASNDILLFMNATDDIDVLTFKILSGLEEECDSLFVAVKA